MRDHHGMRPQDIVILLKIAALGDKPWKLVTLASELQISLSEVSSSLSRSQIAGLLDSGKKRILRQNLLNFLEHGLKYVFPVQLGSLVRGMPTAHSHPFFSDKIISEIKYVWPDREGSVMGLEIQPLHPKIPLAARDDENFYKLVALADVMRVGKPREIDIAKNELRRILKNERSVESHPLESGEKGFGAIK